MLDPKDEAELARSVFFPRPDLPYGPEALTAWEVAFEVAPGVRSRLRVFPSYEPRTSADILFFHGNGETARDYDGLAPAYGGIGASLFAAEYRGYGPAAGEPSLSCFLEDAHRTLDQVLEMRAAARHSGPLLVMGRSLGSAPAIELAASRPGDLAALVVESGFARVVPLLELCGAPARRLGVTEEWGPRNLAKMAGVTLPLLVIHAEGDELIPISDAEALFEAAKDPEKVFLRVPHAGHNDIQLAAGESYFEAIRALIQRVSPR